MLPVASDSSYTLRVGYALIIFFFFMSSVFSQSSNDIYVSDFQEDMGIWTQTRSAQIVNVVGDGSPQRRLLLKKNKSGDDPFIATELIDLGDYCGVNLSIDLMVLNASSMDEHIYLEVSSDGGETFNVLREIGDLPSLTTQSWQNGLVKKFTFPIRSFLKNEMILRLATSNLSRDTRVYVDNILFSGKSDDDNLLAAWQMGSHSNSEVELSAKVYNGNCVATKAGPIFLSQSGEHTSASGYNYQFLADISKPTSSNGINNGALCIELGESSGDTAGIAFSVTIGPDSKGQITGLEFMEKAPASVNGLANNYPEHFELKIYKEDELIFSQANIETSRDWSEKIFRLSHIQELIVSVSTEFIFELIPNTGRNSESALSVWFLDEIKVMGGCCEADCDLLEIRIDHEESDGGVILRPILERDSGGCFSECEGVVTNNNAEYVAGGSTISLGWTYHNDAETIANSEFDAPENFDEYSFHLNHTAGSEPQFMESDIINLCPGDSYSVCFDHIANQETTMDKIAVTVHSKKSIVSSGSSVSESCMSFIATSDNHKIGLFTQIEGSGADIDFYLDNIEIHHLASEVKEEVSAVWHYIKNQDNTNQQSSVINKVKYEFRLNSNVDALDTYKGYALYNLCFSTIELQGPTIKDDMKKLVLVINGNLEKTFDVNANTQEYCMSFMTDQVLNSLEYYFLNSEGNPSSIEQFVLSGLKLYSMPLYTEKAESIHEFQWTRPDGTVSYEQEIIADQDGEYQLTSADCNSCGKVLSIKNEINKDVCPGRKTVDCSESLDPNLNSMLNLLVPAPPYSIGNRHYEDYSDESDCANEISRKWTVERWYKDSVYDTTTCVQSIKIRDWEAPELPFFKPKEISCDWDLPVATSPRIIDNCSNFTLESEDVWKEGSGCPGDPIVISRYWFAEDACGNSSTSVEKFLLVFDAPEIKCPASVTVNCLAEIVQGKPFIDVTCNRLQVGYNTELKLAAGPEGCNGSIYEMTYRSKDDCGREASCVQTFTLAKQVLTISCPADVTVDCLKDFSTSQPVIFSTCEYEVDVTTYEPKLNFGNSLCDGASYVVLYKVINTCSEATCTQQLSIENNGTQVVCPTDRVVSCPEEIISGEPEIIEPCGIETSYYVHPPQLISGNMGCDGALYNLRYSVNDHCDIQLDCVQNFSIQNPGLSITCPADEIVSCHDEITLGELDITSYCDSNPVFTTTEAIAQATELGCDGEIYDLTYTATDDCGSSQSCVQRFTINNSGLMIICPSDTIVNCIESVVPEIPTVISSCQVEFAINSFSPLLMNGLEICDGAEYIITYEVQDLCGNIMSCDQVFSIDNEGLTIDCPPDITVSQLSEVQGSSAIVNQPCGLNYNEAVANPLIIHSSCQEIVYLINYSATDDCMTTVSCEQYFTLNDDDNALDSEFICGNISLFEGLDCDQGGTLDEDECAYGSNPEDPCDDVSFVLESNNAQCYGEASGNIHISIIAGNPPYEFSLDQVSWTWEPYFENLSAGEYVVYVRTTEGPYCEFEFSEFISQPELTLAEAGPDQEICIGFVAELQASGGDNYLWSTGDPTAIIQVSPLVGTTYFVTVTQSDGCRNVDEVTVTVHQNNSAVVSDTLEICSDNNQSVLSAGGGVSYVWSTGDNDPIINVTPEYTTSYSVTVTDENGCTDVAETEVIVNENTTAAVIDDQEICMGYEADLSASGGVSYLWSNGSRVPVITVSPSESTTYHVTVTDENGCVAIENTTVIVQINNSAEVTTDMSLCIGESSELVANGGMGYLWSTEENTSSITVSPLVSTTYTVTVTDANGCTDIAEVDVTVNELPIAEITGPDQLCLSESIDLQATGGNTYLWSNGQNTNMISVSPTSNIDYSVTVTDANGCTAIALHSVMVNENTTAVLIPDQEVCTGSSVLLIASGGTSYLWSTGDTAASITVAPVVTSTYSVTVTDENGCIAIDTVEVLVHELPEADAGNDRSVCLNETIVLSASGGMSYLWSTEENTSSITVSPLVTTTYIVTVTDQNGCTDSDDLLVTVNPLPDPFVIGLGQICLGDEIEISAEGGSLYLWSNSETSSTIMISPSEENLFFVTVTDNMGCTAIAEHMVVVDENTSAAFSPDEEICIGSSVDLSASGSASYLWSTGETTDMITVSPVVTTAYAITATDDNGCTATNEVTVTVLDLPIVNAGANATICYGDSIELTATGGIEYSWSNNETGNSIVVTPVINCTYYVTVTDEAGCVASDSVTVTLLDLPYADAGMDETMCSGENVSLSASGGISYLWSTGATDSEISVSPSMTEFFFVTVTNDEGCFQVDSVLVEVYDLPLVDAGEDQNICLGESIELIATGGESYLWNTGQTGSSINVNPSSESSYAVTATDSNGCTGETSVNVFVHDYPTADAGGWALACGEGVTDLTATGGIAYVWSTGETTATISVSPAEYTAYSVTVSDTYGCSDEAVVHVYVLEGPNADAGADQEICEGGSAQLYASSGDDFLWQPDLFLDDNTRSNPISTPDTTITYVLTVSDESGCTATDEVTISIPEDTQPPVALCMNITLYTDSSGEAQLTPEQLDDNSHDNCSIPSLVVSETQFACLHQDYTVVLTVTDAAGNSSTCESIVTLTGPDDDCDLMDNGCDLCDGGDDTVDNDNDGLPDCAYPPSSYTDLEELWKCDSSGVSKVWVCHAPDQSICIDYMDVYTHVSYHQGDYLGPCHAIGCYADTRIIHEEHQEIHDLGSKKIIDLSCETAISNINCRTQDIDEILLSSLKILESPCDIMEIITSPDLSKIRSSLCSETSIITTFEVKDECGNKESCFTTIISSIKPLIIYPNPAREELKISGLDGESYVIYNLIQQKVKIGNSERIKISELNAGVHILITENGRSLRFTKVD